MLKVEIYKLNNEGTQDIIAYCVLNENKEVSCYGDGILVSNLEKYGIKNYDANENQLLYPKDGEFFLRQLCKNFKSVYLNASEVMSLND